MKKISRIFFFLVLTFYSCSDNTTKELEKENIPEQTPDKSESIAKLPILHVEGRFLRNEQGETVNLHGFSQTYSPFFNNNAWTNYNVTDCLNYNKRLIDEIIVAGWKVNFIRLHMDPYWSDDTSKPSVRYEGHERFSQSRFEKYLNEVFLPMAKYAIGKGIYVVMRPPGVCPEKISVGDDYQKFLLTVWDIVSKHSEIKNNSDIMFELANEPITILGTDNTYAGSGDGHFLNLQNYFQKIVEKIRANEANNIIWVPGLSYQSNYSGYAVHPIVGKNIGYAVHAYPGWYGSDAEVTSSELGGVMGGGYQEFQRGWDAQVGPVINFAPIMVTEVDWAPKKYDSSWGKSITGIMGGSGFGANFKYIADKSGNVSWLIFTSCHLLAQFKDVAGTAGNYTFLNDPEACLWPVYHWFKEYSEKGEEKDLSDIELIGVSTDQEIRMGDSKNIIVKALYTDGSERAVTLKSKFENSSSAVLRVENSGKVVVIAEGTATVTVTYTSEKGVSKQKSFIVRAISPFPLTSNMFNPSIFGDGKFDESTKTLVTGEYGFGGWKFADGLNLSGYKTLIVELGNDNESNVSFRLFDKNSYWSQPAIYDFSSSRKVVVDLNKMVDENNEKIDPSHLYIVGFWSVGGKPIVISNILLTH